MNKPPTTPQARRASRGFSLAEVMVTLAVLATLLTLAIAGWSAVATSMKLTALTNTMLTQLHTARSEAIKRNARVAMCKSADGVTCTGSGGWEQGWLVFHDANNSGTREPQETLIYQIAALPAGFRVSGNLSVAKYVSFAGNGGTLLASGAFQAGTLTLCKVTDAAVAEARQIVINAVGRPRVKKTTVDFCA
ncbi:MAG: GspH/FimT family protein [Burkholderiales bacterium]|nr:GspH/FimT family protein [Burkholderiales bacterium]